MTLQGVAAGDLLGLPAVSVALCTYNGARFLGQQLQSLAAQTHRPAELVVCDDRSTDDTVPMLQAFAASSLFPVRIVINDERLGYRANFKKAARLCREGVIAFCDQDDIWLPDKLQACCQALQNPAVSLVVHEGSICDAAGAPSGQTVYGGQLEARICAKAYEPWLWALGLTEVFRRELLDVPGLDDVTDPWSGQGLAHDQLVFFAAVAAGTITVLDRPLVLYRQHGGNTVGMGGFDLRKKIDYLVMNRAVDYARFAAAALSMAKFIQRRIEQGAQHGAFSDPSVMRSYTDLAEIYRLRALLYSTDGFWARTRVYRSLLAVPAYGADPWKLPSKHLLRDSVLGVVLHGLLHEAHPDRCVAQAGP